jgi:hypothetical protein
MEVKHDPLTLIVPQFETPLMGNNLVYFRSVTRSISASIEITSEPFVITFRFR